MINNTDDVTYFKGNVFNSTIGISKLIVLAIALVSVYVLRDIRPGFFILLIFLPLMMTQYGACNYYGVSTYYIVVRNHGWIWRRKKFYNDEIREIVFDKLGFDNCLVITLNNNQKYTYRAETLKDIHWLGLMKALTERGVLVTDKENLAVLVTPGMKKVNRILRLLFFAYFVFIVCSIFYIDTLIVWSTKRNVAAVLFFVLFISLPVGIFFLQLKLYNKHKY